MGEVIVPRSSVGIIIGKGGDTIKRMAQETGAKIQFKPDGSVL
jgi:far upstream element-binding protein